MKTKNDYCEITIVDIHAEYPLQSNDNVDIREMWDGGQYENDINDYLQKYYPKLPPIDETHLTEMMNDAMKSYDAPQPCDPIDDPRCYLFKLIGRKYDLCEYVNSLAVNVVDAAMNVGGDDDYYDYFPNYVAIFHALCRELGLRELFERVMKTIQTISLYADDDDNTLNHEF